MTAPDVHDLTDLIEACGLVTRELLFQVSRLDTQVTPKSPEEKDYLDKLRKGYSDSAYWTQVLQRYTISRRKNSESPYDKE